MAPPRMQKYIDYAAEDYGIYLKYISKDDIHVYSIDEAFLDITLPSLLWINGKEMAVSLYWRFNKLVFLPLVVLVQICI